ncbi:hypothetical protein AAD001_00430 [Colwelliaceae bacterium 6471]
MISFVKMLILLMLPLNSLGCLASELANQTWQIHGFAAQGVINVSGSDFVNDDGRLSTELTEVGINASYQLSPFLRAAGQLVYIDGGNRYNKGVRADYLLLDWSIHDSEQWLVNLYLGRFKNNHWLYSSTRDVPFTRPTIILPQGVYFDGFRDIAVGGDGANVKVRYSSDEYGNFDLNVSTGASEISTEQTKIILSEFALGDMGHENDTQLSLYWQPIYSSWRFGFALLDSDFTYKAQQHDAFSDANIVLQRYFINALYEGERWEFSSEVFQERFVMDGFYFADYHQDNFGQGYFLQSRYTVDPKLKLLMRYEHFVVNKDDRSGKKLEQLSGGAIPHYFGYLKELTFGVEYQMSERVKFQFEYHLVDGTARLTPVVLPNTQLNDDENWQMWAAQIMYWF